MITCFDILLLWNVQRMRLLSSWCACKQQAQTTKMASNILLPLVLLAAFQSLNAWKPSLSDNLGMFKPAEQFGASENYVVGSVWPKPQSEKRGSTVFSLSPEQFKFSSIGQQSSVLSQAMARYIPLVFPDKKVPLVTSNAMVETLQIKVMDPYAALALETDESCKMIRPLISL